MTFQTKINAPLTIDVPSGCHLELEDIPDECDHVPVIDGGNFVAFEPGTYCVAFVDNANDEKRAPLTVEVS